MTGQPKRIAFLGVDSMASFENMKYWSLGKSHIEKYKAEDRPDRVDVFGVGHKDGLRLPHPCGPAGVESLAQDQPIWMHFPPKDYDRVAANRQVSAVALSGRAEADAKVVLNALKAGKAVFVESVEHFSDDAMQQVAQLAGAPGGPAFLTGLYQRFDAQLSHAAQDGIENRVGKPLLYQAYGSTLDDSLFDLGMQHVDAVRFVLGSEPVEIFASGSANDLSCCEALALTLKLANGTVALLSLDRSGTAGRERVLVVGDQSRAEFEADLLQVPGLSARVLRLQKAGMNHFIQVALEGAQPRMSLDDIMAARAVMLAAQRSLRSGGLVALQPRAGAVTAAAGVRQAGGALAGTSSWVSQAVNKAAEAAAQTSHILASALNSSPEAEQSNTTPRSARPKGAHLGLGTSTPDSPELLLHPSMMH